MIILGVDIGTTAMKMAVFQAENDGLSPLTEFSEGYSIHTYNDGLFSDIDQDTWKETFSNGCRSMADHIAEVDVISLSGTTPGLTAMDSDGNALYPAILMLDQRSRKQAQEIIQRIGLSKLLETTGNMPVAGGCSLASILWIRDNYPDLFNTIRMFGHSNTYIGKWLTGKFAIDPSSASLTALYNTAANDLSWNRDIAQEFDIPIDCLPPVIPSYESVGRVTDELARDLGFRKRPAVVIGGNDAVLAAYSVGIEKPGDIVNINGTCEITMVCLSECAGTSNYNIRAHVLDSRWLTLYVMNAGGKALDWFCSLFCSEMDADTFFTEFIPSAIDKWLHRQSSVTYVPYLMGSRYSQEPLKAEFRGLTSGTSREEMLAAVIRGLCYYQREHLKEVALDLSLAENIHVTGGALNSAIIQAKKKWLRNCEYIHEKESSVRGAALLGVKYLSERQ